MRGLVGQPAPKEPHRKIISIPIEETKNYIDLSKGGAYKIYNIDYDIPKRGEKSMNANIRGHILDEDTMKDLGFIKRRNKWVFKEKVSHIDTMEEYLVVTVKDNPKDIVIRVFDEFLKKDYDYQEHMRNEPYNQYANIIHSRVQEIMMRLVKAGVISGYEKDDYI